MTLDMKEELLLVMLFLGFLLLPASLALTIGFNRGLPSPNAGAVDTGVAEVGGTSLVDVSLPSSLLTPAASLEDRLSLGCSCMLAGAPPRASVVAEDPWYKGGVWRPSRLTRLSLVPDVAG